MSPIPRAVAGTTLAMAAPDRSGNSSGDEVGLRAAQAFGLGLAAALGHRFREGCEQHRNHSHSAICSEKAMPAPPLKRSCTTMAVTSSATISVTKITGLRMSWRGSSLSTASPRAGTRISGLKIEMDGWSWTCLRVPEASGRRAWRNARRWAREPEREELQPAHDEDDADQEADKQRPVGGKSAGEAFGVRGLAASNRQWPVPARCRQSAPSNMARARVVLYQQVVLPPSPPKAEPLLPAAELKA